jgi:hypothetical protein
MSGHVTTYDGGAAAPTAVEEGKGAAATVGSQGDLMHQHGGQAPDAAPTPGAPEPSAPQPTAGGMPAEGGFVRAR